MTTDNKAARAITQARTALILDEPFFGTLALRLHVQEATDPACKTLRTNSVLLEYNPAYVNSLSHDTLKAAIAHEVLHVTNGHCWRKGDRDHKKFNVAADYAINPVLRDSGFVLGHDWLIDPQYNGMSAEQIYDMLPDSKDDDDSNGGDPVEGFGPGEFEQAPDDEQADLEAQWKVSTIQAAQMAQAQGSLPGALKGLIKQLKQTRTDWRSATLKFAQERSKNDFSYTAPNKRYVQHGLYLPSMRSEQMGEIVAVIDTSGSTQHVLPMFGAHLQTILDTVRPRALHVIYCDDGIQHVDTFEPDDTLTIRKDGGGGTSFIPPFDYVDANAIEPACLIYLTDLEGPAPAHAPGYPVLWACTERDNVAAWGETIYIGDA